MMTEFPVLRTERLLLRRFRQSDLQDVFYGLSHPEVIRFYGVNYTSLEGTQAQLDWFREVEETKSGLWWAIVSPDDQVFYGAGGFYYWKHEHQKAEIGFWLLPEHWGKGIMGEAMPVIESYAFDTLHIHRLEGFVESDNSLCQKAMRKLHYTHEGTMHDCEIKNGRFISLDIYAKLRNVSS